MGTSIGLPAATDAMKFCLALVVGAPLLLAGCCPSSDWSETSLSATEKRGEPIVAALEAYRAAHGEYPEKLNALIPQYMKEIKPPLVGNHKWHYWRSRKDKDWYELGAFDDSKVSHNMLNYSSRTYSWRREKDSSH